MSEVWVKAGGAQRRGTPSSPRCRKAYLWNGFSSWTTLGQSCGGSPSQAEVGMHGAVWAAAHSHVVSVSGAREKGRGWCSLWRLCKALGPARVFSREHLPSNTETLGSGPRGHSGHALARQGPVPGRECQGGRPSCLPRSTPWDVDTVLGSQIQVLTGDAGSLNGPLEAVLTHAH